MSEHRYRYQSIGGEFVDELRVLGGAARSTMEPSAALYEARKILWLYAEGLLALRVILDWEEAP